MKRKKLYIAILLLAGVLTSCKVGKSYVRPDLHLPDSLERAQDSISFGDQDWRDIYTDATLRSLIERALDHNKDMLIAAARVKEMAAQKRISTAALLPDIKGKVTAERELENHGGDAFKRSETFEAQFLVSWELDLWGNLRWARSASIAEYLQSIEAQRALRMTIVAEVAQAYYELVALDTELDIVKQTLKAREEGVRLARIRFAGGLTSETSYRQAQVELAQLEYMLPRLRGWGGSLSRQAGGRAAGADAGIGSRGPGETKIEMDRRVIRTRIARLRRQIREMAPAREVKRGSRRRFGLPTVAVVGYTNAGKSSLTNRLTGSAELVGNALFATLDTAVRRAKTRDGRAYAYVDTVGFVRRLPTQLVEAFKSTLEEVAEADVILHVVDGSHPDPFSQVDAVNDVLADIEGTASIPRILVFNKADQADEATRERLAALQPDAFIVSAYTGEGLDELRTAVESLLPVPHVHVNALLPYAAGSLISRVREYGKVDKVEYRDDGIQLEADVDAHLAAQVVEQSID